MPDKWNFDKCFWGFLNGRYFSNFVLVERAFRWYDNGTLACGFGCGFDD
jgi:hypothetical protein